MNASVKHADHYTRQFPSPLLAIVCRGVSFVVGGVVGVLLVFTFMDEAILLYVEWGGHNLLWYFGVFSAVLAVARAFVPGPGAKVHDPNAATRVVATYTHHLPRAWRRRGGRCHTPAVRDAFLALFPYKLETLLHEVVSIAVTPPVARFFRGATLCFSSS